MKAVRYAKFLTGLLAVFVAHVLSVSTEAAEIVIGNPETPYETPTDAVLKSVLENRLGVDVRTVVASAAVVFKAMDANKGAIDIDPGMQMPTNVTLFDEFVTHKKTVIVAHNSWQFLQGTCTTKATAEKYNIKSIYDMLRPEIVQLTAKGDDKGEYWVGAPDWNATAIEMVRAKYLGLNDIYHLTTSEDVLEYARVGDAIKTGRPIFWACDGASNFIFPQGSVVMLKGPPYDPAKWHPVLPSKDPDWYEKSVVDTSWPPVTVRIAYAK
jgi:ABC-type proline/glycine betaine transport system substrate-binding protein